jgi:diaminopimelate decarboxylase
MDQLIENYPYLSYKNKKLNINEQPVETFLESIVTPIFVFLPTRFLENIDFFEIALQKHVPNVFISYAIKANYLGKVLLKAKSRGIGVEAMSLFEMKLAERAGFDWDQVIFNGPAKATEELQYAISKGVEYINVDSLDELKLIAEIAKKNQKIQPVTIRIHPQLKEETEKRLLIRKNSKLGVDFTRGLKLFRFARDNKNLNPIGVHVHVGTNLTSHDFYDELLSFLNSYIVDLKKKENVTIKQINLGGGLASKSILDSKEFSLEKLGKQIAEKIDDVKDKLIIFEPGRYLIEDSFIAVTRIVRTKKTWGRKWAFTDIGANSLIPMRYSHYKAIPVHNKGKDQYCNLGGPLCLPVDVLSNEAVSFKVEEHDALVILNCGAYTLSMSEQFGYPRPAVYEINEENKLELIKPADNLEKMIDEAF